MDLSDTAPPAKPLPLVFQAVKQNTSDDSDSSISLIYDRFPPAVLRGRTPFQRPVDIELRKLKGHARRQCDKEVIRHQKRAVGSGFHAFFPLKPMQ